MNNIYAMVNLEFNQFLTRLTQLPIPILAVQWETKQGVSMASGADRISALPDEVIHHVLSFLPMHEVVLTSLVARRWRDLWKSAPAVHITGVKDCNNPEWFIQYVNNLLLLRHPGARLDSFNLDLDECDFDFKPFLPNYHGSVTMWFRNVLLCQARVVSLRTTPGIYNYEWDWPLNLPDVPIISQHLKILDLERVTLNMSTLDFSGCPALVDLKMKECEIHGNVTSTFLKQLSITCCDFSTCFRARIYMPGLISLVLSEFAGRTPLLENMPLLVSAIVRVTNDCEDECSKSSYGDCGDHTCFACYDSDQGDDWSGESLLLKGLSQVTELDLSVDSKVVCFLVLVWFVMFYHIYDFNLLRFAQFIVNRDLKFRPSFRKLKSLFLGEWCPGVAADLNILTCFLQHSPILEKLVLQLSKVLNFFCIFE